jgi:hypothetical protein
MEQYVIKRPPLHERLPWAALCLLVLTLGWLILIDCAPYQNDTASGLVYALAIIMLAVVALIFGANAVLWRRFELTEGVLVQCDLVAWLSMKQSIYTTADVSHVMIAKDRSKPFHYYNPYNVLIVLVGERSLLIQCGLSEEEAKSLASTIALQLHTNVDPKVESLKRQWNLARSFKKD